MAAVFEERTRDREPSGQFGPDVATYNRTYVLYELFPDGTSHVPKLGELYDRIKQITGTTLPGPAPGAISAPGGAGCLVRTMPMADPQFNSLFGDVTAVSVVNLEGYVSDSYGGGPLAVMPTQGFARYAGYELAVTFGARPYAVLPNERMVMSFGDFYDVDGSRKRLWYAPEYLRFVQTFVEDVDSRVSASVGGSMKFRIPSAGVDADGNPKSPDASAYSGIPDMLIPDQGFKLRWYQIPLRYLTSPNSYLVRYKGFINQWPFINKPIGSWLYVKAVVAKTYTPPTFAPTQQPSAIDGFANILTGSFFNEPLVDLELSFIWTARRRYPPEVAPGNFTTDPDVIPGNERPNKSWLDAPHNWLPSFGLRRYHYAHLATTPHKTYSGWLPQYPSVPLQILFMDPDVPDIVINL